MTARQLVVQPNLVERVVFEAARREPAFRAPYERQFADCHEPHDPARREQAFLALHDRWFRELGYSALLHRLIDEFPFLRRDVLRFMVTQAGHPRAQIVELFGKPRHYTVVMAVAPRMFLDVPAFEYWARHELLHIDDMLNPAFEYVPTDAARGYAVGSGLLANDRLSVLWALSVDARLEKAGKLPVGIRERRASELARAFGFAQAEESWPAFDALWNECRDTLPPLPQFLDWSANGLHRADTERTATAAPSRNGTRCPLCRFPTYDWWPESAMDADGINAIRADFPAWTPSQGLCGRCAEVYRAGVQVPASMQGVSG